MPTDIYFSVTSDSDRSVDLPSSQLAGAEIPSSQSLFARTPGSSQLDESNITDRSLSDISDSEKSQWREYLDPKGFFDYTGWSAAYFDHFVFSADLYLKGAKASFSDMLFKHAKADLSALSVSLKAVPENDDIEWTKFPLTHEAAKTESAVDDLIFAWVQVKKISYYIDDENLSSYAYLLSRMSPKVRSADRKSWYETAARAFYSAERPAMNGHLPSKLVYQQLLDCYKKYTKGSFLAPYTSIVGPSGIGKSFIIRQMAVQHGIYVAYTSFAREDSRAYPGRSVIANKIPNGLTRQPLVEFWKTLITVSLTEVEVCGRVGVTPAGLYNLQTMERYEEYQKEFSKRVMSLSSQYQNSYSGAHGAKLAREMKDYLSSHCMHSQGPMYNWYQALVSHGDNPEPDLSKSPSNTHRHVPQMLFCFDEARWLTDSNDSLLFRSLRQALRERFQSPCMSVEDNLPDGDFFAVFLDTSSRVVDFSPPTHLDRSQKIMDPMGYSGALLPPIYTIRTKDVFCDKGDTKKPHDGSMEAVMRLFRFGRPLWGSRYQASNATHVENPIRELIGLATRKTDGEGATKAIALLSYRVHFYVTSHHLAEEMVSSCLRCIMYINKGRNLLRTFQPSEPVLAYTAATKMSNPTTRFAVVKHFVAACFEGTVSMGDIGEIVASMMLLFAYDELQFHQPKALPTPIALQKFMTSLFGQDRCAGMTDRMHSDDDMRDLWDNGLVFFNQFIRLQHAPDQDTLERLFNRGAAVFLPGASVGADIIVPVRIADAEMSFCIIQVKNRKDDHPTPSLRLEAVSSLKDSASAYKWSKHHIGIMMCLRHQARPGSENFAILLPEKYTCRATRLTPQTDASGNTLRYKWPANDKNLVVMAMGLDETIYPFINTCCGECTDESTRVMTLLHQLLDCIPQVTFPEDADQEYMQDMMSID